MGLNELFEAKSIAVIGASHQQHKVGHDIFRNLLQSNKKIYPINPNSETIFGLKCYPDILSVKESIDLAVIAVPSQIVPKIMLECVEKKIKNAIIISAGFSEAGNTELENQVLKTAKTGNIRILGPNCLGVISTADKLNATFFNELPPCGGISFVSQSGALGVAVLDWAIKKKIGLSKFISVGNMADIGIHEIINYLNEDKETKVICLYIEGLKDGKKFIDAAKTSKKPIIVLKAGETKSGNKAAMSHTGALATESAIYDGVFKQCRITKVKTLFQLFEVAQLYTYGICPRTLRGAIITNAGGAGVIASDSFERNDLTLEKMPELLIKKLDKILPLSWSHNNPIDIIGDALPERYDAVLKSIEDENFYDFIFLILTPQTMSQPEKVAEILAEFQKKTSKPCFACFMGGKSVDKAKIILNKNKILNFEEPENGAEVIGKMKYCNKL